MPCCSPARRSAVRWHCCSSGLAATGFAARTFGGGSTSATSFRGPAARCPGRSPARAWTIRFPGMLSNAAEVIRRMDVYAAAGHKFDYWWTDAGWYATTRTGTTAWAPGNPTRTLSQGPAEATDHAAQVGMKYVVWFEPERVAPGSWLDRNHPEWLLGGKRRHAALESWQRRGPPLVTDHVDKLLAEQGIDLYRQDFNIEPLGFWRGADAPGRAGMTEMKYLMGYLAYWDELRRRHPDMLIDTCASGGRRLDLETLRRAVPLAADRLPLRARRLAGADVRPVAVGHVSRLGRVPGLALHHATHMNACFGYGANMPSQKPDFALLAKMDRQWRQIAERFVLGDFYPLADYSLANDVWMAWQFDRPEIGRGASRSSAAATASRTAATSCLRGLDPAAVRSAESRRRQDHGRGQSPHDARFGCPTARCGPIRPSSHTSGSHEDRPSSPGRQPGDRRQVTGVLPRIHAIPGLTPGAPCADARGSPRAQFPESCNFISRRAWPAASCRPAPPCTR